MNAQHELRLEPTLEPANAREGDAEPARPAASQSEPSATSAESRRTEPTFDKEGAKAPPVEPPRLQLVPYFGPARTGARSGRGAFAAWASGIAAGLALFAALIGVGLYDHARQSSMLAARAEESRGLAETVKSLKDRVDSMEAARVRDHAADLRKVAAELKTQSGASRDLGTTLAQLAARVDRVEHDQNARLDKLGERIDHDSTARIAELTTRIDKLEKKPVASVALAVPPTPPAPSPRQAAAVAKPDPAVSYETTGSIDRQRPALRGYWLVDVAEGSAVIDGRDGPREVAPGDFLPGAGRVLRIERRGRDWVVVTSAGVIAGEPPRF